MTWSTTEFEEVFTILDNLFPDHISFLRYETPFQLLVAVILSARTTDRQVNRVTETLFARYPTPAALAAAGDEDLEEILRPLGFYRRKADHIRRAAAAAGDRPLPEDMEGLLRIPGVGRKAANVILGALFGKPAVIVDTHFLRVANRLGWTDADNPEIVERELKKRIPPEKQYRTSMMLNLLGRQLCRPRAPDCVACPVRGYCPYRAQSAG